MAKAGVVLLEWLRMRRNLILEQGGRLHKWPKYKTRHLYESHGEISIMFRPQRHMGSNQEPQKLVEVHATPDGPESDRQ